MWYYVIVVLSKHRFNGNEGGGAIGFVQKHTGYQEGCLLKRVLDDIRALVCIGIYIGTVYTRGVVYRI